MRRYMDNVKKLWKEIHWSAPGRVAKDTTYAITASVILGIFIAAVDMITKYSLYLLNQI